MKFNSTSKSRRAIQVNSQQKQHRSFITLLLVFGTIFIFQIGQAEDQAPSIAMNLGKVDFETKTDASALDSVALEAIAREAYIYTYPMLRHYNTLYRSAIAGQKGVAPRGFNRFFHRRNLLGPKFKLIVGPNNDTLYSSVWLDLRSEPIVIEVPPFPQNRYYSFQFIDAYVNNFAYIGQRTSGNNGGRYLITAPGGEPYEVEGIDRVIQSESEVVFIIGRILVDGKEDIDNVVALQDKIKAIPLSQYQGDDVPAEKPALYFPQFDSELAKTYQFVDYINAVLPLIVMHPEDRAAFEGFASIGIKLDPLQSTEPLMTETRQAINSGVQAALSEIAAASKSYGVDANGWNQSAIGFGGPDTRRHNLLARAAAAMTALYGNNREENNSFITFRDHQGQALNGSIGRYTLTFDRGQQPPVDAFWSVTMYQIPGLHLVENSINRYSIGDRSKSLHLNADGSLTIYLQHDAPSIDKKANWLPAPKGTFGIALRMYRPKPVVLNGTWVPPPLMPARREDG